MKQELLKQKEEKIKNLINTDKSWKNAFNTVKLYYETDMELHQSLYYKVLIAIYVENTNKQSWKLANDCNISRTTLFVYRNEIIKCFEKCHNNNFVVLNLDDLDEVALTEIFNDLK